MSELKKKKASQLILKGHTSQEVAEKTGTDYAKLKHWLETELADDLDRLAAIRDEEAERALFLKATGYSHPEEKLFCYMGEIIRETTMKHYPPDTQALQFWLKNKRPDTWNDKPKTEIDFEAELTAHLPLED